MSIGYACLARALPNTEMKKCLIKNADDVRLRLLISSNLQALERILDYNISNGIRLFRISSDIIPFASGPINKVPWADDFGDRLASIGQKIRRNAMRVSMHPGQYTVLNSPNPQTVDAAIRELAYHAMFLDSLGMDDSNKIILHVGGVYGDKFAAIQRFQDQYQLLSDTIKARLVIENDDKAYNVEDVLEISRRNRIPVVFDILHHQANSSFLNHEASTWISECAGTWQVSDGRQKIHYSQPDMSKKPGAHSPSIDVDHFLPFYSSLKEPIPDIMLEVKDKNISALKCILCTAEGGNVGALEREWGRYKYLVLEHSQRHYQQIRQLLKDKAAYPAVEFYRLVKAALSLPVDTGSAMNAAMHVWGYFKESTSASQKADFQKTLDAFSSGNVQLASLKSKFFKLAELFKQDYLLQSYYFL